MVRISGNTRNNSILADMLVQELDPKTFEMLKIFIRQADAKAILLQNRAKRHGF